MYQTNVMRKNPRKAETEVNIPRKKPPRGVLFMKLIATVSKTITRSETTPPTPRGRRKKPREPNKKRRRPQRVTTGGGGYFPQFMPKQHLVFDLTLHKYF
jgi:hypothetical protein